MPGAPFPNCDNQKWTHILSKCPLQDIFTPGGGPLRWLSCKESTCQCGRHRRLRFDPWVRKVPWRGKWQPTPVFLPGKSHGQGSLVGYSPWGHKESDMTEQLTLLYIYNGEENDKPLQYTCLGNPTDRGVWWAIVHEVTKSWI